MVQGFFAPQANGDDSEPTGYLFLADDDLYDAGTGELLLKNWLRGDHPVRVFYDDKTKKILGQYQEGFVRYNFDGSRDAVMMQMVNPPAFSPNFKKAVYIKNKDVWAADIDWQKLAFVNERQVTTMGVFYEQHFAENVPLLTAKTLVVHNLNNLLRVDLENGKVKPSSLPLQNIAKRRSPDSKSVVGCLNGQFYCYDVDADTTKMIPVGRNGTSDYQWLNNNKCVALAAEKEIVVYDRNDNTLTESAVLPFKCFKIGEPSPDGHFIFAAGGINGRNGALVDVEKKTAPPITGGAGITWVSNDALAFSRDLPDSDVRGTWLQNAGQSDRRISTEPYLVGSGGAQLMTLPAADLIILETGNGLLKMKLDGSGIVKLNDSSHRLVHLIGIQKWKSE